MPYKDPEKAREYNRRRSLAYYYAHPEKKGVWAKANRDRKNAAYKRWRDKNPEKARANVARWRAANPEWVKARDKERSTWRRGGAKNSESREYVLMLMKDPCSYCGAPSQELDHIDPISRGGQHDWSNLTAACLPCNRSKFTKSPLPFLAQRGGGANAFR